MKDSEHQRGHMDRPCGKVPPHEPPHDATPIMITCDISKLFDNIMHSGHDGDHMQNSCRHLLFHLAREDGVTQLRLAQLTNLKAPTVSVTLQKMERDGYVTRRADENDLRQTLVFLTPKGYEYNERIHTKVKKLDARALSGLDENERETVMKILLKIRLNLIEEAEKATNEKAD